MKKPSLYFLITVLMLAVITSCGSESAEIGNINDNEPAATTEADLETITTGYMDSLPDGLDFGGEKVTFLYREEVCDDFYADTANGEIVNDDIYKSILSVEERLAVDIVTVARAGHTTDVRQEYMNHISNTILAGDDLYDWVDLMIGNSPVMMSKGIFADIIKNRYIDLNQPYYLSQLVDTVTIDGKLYFISGDASLGYIKCAFCMYFNKQLVEDYNIENLYSVVDNGKWTLDKVMSVSVIASQDINNDGVYDLEDQLGFVVHDTNHPKGFWASADIEFYKKNSDGEWGLDFGSERDADVVNKLYTLFFNSQGSYFGGVTNAVPDQIEKYNQIAAKFASGDIFIITAELDDSVAQLRNMESPYGILPYPKYDEEQSSYRSSSRNTHNAFSMPVTCSHPDTAGAVLEALSSIKYNTVLPTYFETALKQKYARDDDSSRMYDIIRDCMTLDFGYTYGNAIGSPEGVFNDSYRKENSLISNYAKKEKSLNTALEKYLAQVRENCE